MTEYNYIRDQFGGVESCDDSEAFALKVQSESGSTKWLGITRTQAVAVRDLLIALARAGDAYPLRCTSCGCIGGEDDGAYLFEPCPNSHSEDGPCEGVMVPSSR